MFTKSARYYDRLYGFKDYAAAAEQLHRRVQTLRPGAGRLLDVGCGTGRHLETLRQYYAVEGLDLNPNLLEIARARLPDVAFHVGDMTSFALGRTFDVVTSLFSSIGYVRTTENLGKTLSCIAKHLVPGGLALIEPWFTPETYWTGTVTANFVNDPDLKVAWMYVSERRDNLAVLDIHYMVGAAGGIEQFDEIHEMGLFSHEDYLNAFRVAGLIVEHERVGFFGRGLYLGMRPGDA